VTHHFAFVDRYRVATHCLGNAGIYYFMSWCKYHYICVVVLSQSQRSSQVMSRAICYCTTVQYCYAYWLILYCVEIVNIMTHI